MTKTTTKDVREWLNHRGISAVIEDWDGEISVLTSYGNGETFDISYVKELLEWGTKRGVDGEMDSLGPSKDDGYRVTLYI